MRFIAIMAHQRSGTHFLGSAVASHPDIKYTGEIFCRHVPSRMSDVRARILRVACGAKVICLDTKYNQISPPLEKFLARHEVKVIHLVRRDRLAAYFSGELHTWRGKHPDADEVPTFCFNLDRYRKIEKSVQRRMRRFGYLTDLRLYYEDLTNNQDTVALPVWASRMICDLVGVYNMQMTTSYGKEAPVDYRAHLEAVPDTIMGESIEANHMESWL